MTGHRFPVTWRVVVVREGLADSTVPRGAHGTQISLTVSEIFDRKKGLITQKNVNSTYVRTVFKIQILKLYRYVNDSPGQVSRRGLHRFSGLLPLN